MGHRLTRQELFNLVWSEPVQKLAKRFEISDVGLAKICKAAQIPLPPRGYWAKVEARQSPPKAVLSIRFPGHSDQVQIGRFDRAWNAPDEPPVISPMPHFDESVDSLKVRVATLVGKFPKRINLDAPHHHVARCLAEDEIRREEAKTNKWTWKKPMFDDPKMRRRLTVANALYNCLANAGCQPQRFSFDADEYPVKVGDSFMNFTIRDGDKKPRYDGHAAAPMVSDRLVLEIQHFPPAYGLQSTWNEVEVGNLSKHIVAIANALMVGAELRLRAWEVQRHESSVLELARYEEALHLQKLEAKTQATLKREREAKLRIATLLRQATNMQEADSIRSLVSAVLSGKSDTAASVDRVRLSEWEKWANGIADQIDPRLLSPDALMTSMTDVEAQG